LQPDLIVAVTADLTREQYDAFSRIAPTVAAPEGAVDGAVPWQDVTRLTSAALGLPGEGDRLVREVEEEFLKAEEAHPELAGATVAAVRPSGTGSFVAWSSRDLRGRFLTDLGMQLPAEVDREAGSGLYATLPAERLAELDRADAILVVGTEAERAALAALPGYDQLSLVQESKVVTLDDEQVAALSINSVLSLPSVVDEVSGRIGRAVER
jgi:iron complex transport system substrate-binding protein